MAFGEGSEVEQHGVSVYFRLQFLICDENSVTNSNEGTLQQLMTVHDGSSKT